ncbi:protein spire homolog 1-like [Protopterus annectens]|uniref:protein spire homolog 1-like n=1 Tax=Protopterus annectens TaxID=7888 RepID=UPI001CFA14EA|nr:protein spire homolog 1-like [Protopterus annectens]
MMAKREDDVAGKVDSTGPVTTQQILVGTEETEDLERASGTVLDKADGGTSSSLDTGEDELSLDEILNLYNQPINEEQAWAVCYQCCCALDRREAQLESGNNCMRRIESAAEVRIRRDGTVLLCVLKDDTSDFQCTQKEVIESLGIIIYKALDYGLKANEERELTPPLEKLIDLMTTITECDEDANKDEGYEAQEEEEEEVEKTSEDITRISCFEHVKKICASHLTTPAEAQHHYQAVCRALFAETMELRTFLSKIKNAREHLQKMQEMDKETTGESGSLDELKNTDWVRQLHSNSY